VGYNYDTITNCYASGNVSGSQVVGGLLGENDGLTVTESFWDIETSGPSNSDGSTGKTTAEMQIESTFTSAGWDFVDESVNGTEDIWWILEGKDYPRLWWELTTDEPRNKMVNDVFSKQTKIFALLEDSSNVENRR
jgi:hypothetical protein